MWQSVAERALAQLAAFGTHRRFDEAEQAVGDLAEARKAFAKLKNVPGISPRVLLLWTLYAETQL